MVGVRRKIVEGGKEKTWAGGQLARGLREGKNGKKQNFTIFILQILSFNILVIFRKKYKRQNKENTLCPFSNSNKNLIKVFSKYIQKHST